MTDEPNEIADMFRALGDPTRLRIFLMLRECSEPVAVDEGGEVRRVDGATVGEVCCRITGFERISSTISHHLRELRLAGLITVEHRGKNRIYRIDETAVAKLADFFSCQNAEAQPDCCA